MSAIQYEPRDDQWEDEEEDDTLAGPARPQRRRLGRGGALLIALLVGAIGFYVGVRVEKGQVGSSSSASSGIPSGGFSSRSGAGRIPAAGSAGGGASFGTVAAVNGRTIYVKQASGNTVKVKLVSATKITKSLPVSHKALRPGDSVVVQGASGTGGSVIATSISDTGASSTSSTSSSSSGSSGSSSSGSSSLFGSSAGG